MSRTAKRFLHVLLLMIAISTAFAASALSETVTLRSGGGYAVCANDPAWTYLAGPPFLPLSASPFTAADFAAALSGPPSVVVPPVEGGWNPSLQCDPLAQWISVDCNWGPFPDGGLASTLFARTFNVQTCCITRATLTFCWTVDDFLGDFIDGGANLAGVYLNQVALPIEGGTFFYESGVALDVTALVHCGTNEIHVYDREAGFADIEISGVMFSVTLDIIECPVKTEPSTWGSIKALYR